MTLEARAVTSAEPDRAQPEEPEHGQPEHGQPEHVQSEHSIAPRRPRTIGGAVFLLVLAATLVGVGVVAVSDWQAGLTLTGGALVAAARAVRPACSAYAASSST